MEKILEPINEHIEKNRKKYIPIFVGTIGLLLYLNFNLILDNSNKHQQVKKDMLHIEHIITENITNDNFMHKTLEAHGLNGKTTIDCQKSIENLVDDIKKTDDLDCSTEKKAKRIYDYLWCNVIKSVEKKNYSLIDLLEKGEANCVSFLCLYVHILDKLGIDYRLYQFNEHLALEVNEIDIEPTLRAGFGYNRTRGQLLIKKKIDKSYLISGIYVSRAADEIRSCDYRKAIILCDKAIQIQPNDSLAYVNKAISLEKLGRMTEARVYYERALDLNPYCPSSHLNFGEFFLKLNDKKNALRCFSRALELAVKLDESEHIEKIKRQIYLLNN